MRGARCGAKLETARQRGDVAGSQDGHHGPGSGRSGWRYVPLALILIAVAVVFATGTHRYLSRRS